MVSWELEKWSFKKDAGWACLWCSSTSSFFPIYTQASLSLPFPLKAEFFSYSSANGFYIVSDQIFSYPMRNLSSTETHKGTYSPLQFRPVYTFHPHKGRRAVLFQGQNITHTNWVLLMHFSYTQLPVMFSNIPVCLVFFLRRQRKKVLKNFEFSRFNISRIFPKYIC